MTSLKHSVTGHQISTDDESVEFWEAAGYRREQKATKKAPAKKASSSKSRK